jgi:NADH-quinone oxidoreductase subunit N
MYFDKPIDDMPVEVGGAAQFTLGLNGIAMLALGFFPTLIMAFLHV